MASKAAQARRAALVKSRDEGPVKVPWEVRAALVRGDLARPRDDLKPGYWIEITDTGRAWLAVGR